MAIPQLLIWLSSSMAISLWSLKNFTRIHHRQTALRMLEGRADAGPLWISEALFQQRLQNAVELIPIADTYNQRGTYHAALLTQAPHAQAASALLDFMQTPAAQRIYTQYGFRLPGERA